jgi:hypothetical protein
LPSAAGDVPPEASAAVLKALSSNPDARFSDAREFALALGTKVS